AIEREHADEMPAVVGEEHCIVWGYVDAVRPRVLPLAPRAQEVALAVEDHHRMHAAIKHIDVVVVVDADPANLLERPPVGQLGPVVIDPISIVPASNNHSTHSFSCPVAEVVSGESAAALRAS